MKDFELPLPLQKGYKGKVVRSNLNSLVATRVITNNKQINRQYKYAIFA